MNLKAIHLNNFKSYKGLTKIENLDAGLSPTQNIILLGGMNGAGKTTLLDALFLCFYGHSARNLYPSRGAKNENYDAFIRSCLNDDVKASGVTHASMYVEVHIDEVKIINNFPKNVVLHRLWDYEIINNRVTCKNETFAILENGMPIQELRADEYEDIIHRLLPYSVAEFFFFDGEKIQDFAGDADKQFAASLRDVLEISTYSLLIKDIKEVRSRIVTEYNKNKENKGKLKQLESERAKQETSLYDNERKISTLTDELEILEVEREQIEVQTFRLTRSTADNRDNYQKEKDKKQAEEEVLKKDYFDTAKNYLPFILASDLCQDLEKQLKQEAKYLEFEAAQKALEPQIDKLTHDILNTKPACNPALNNAQRKFFAWKIDDVLRQFLSQDLPIETEDITMIHQLSAPDQNKVIDMLQKYSYNMVDVLQAKAERLKQIEMDLQRIRSVEVRSGDNNDMIKELFDKKEMTAMQIGAIREQIRQAKYEIDEGKRRMTELDKQITNLMKKAELHEKQRKELSYCDKLKDAIKDFQIQFQAKRADELENAILEMWNLLAQKEEYITAIQILPKHNFEVRIFGDNGLEKDKTKLSAGEKEIYAISLLWALIKVSGKEIPVVIDTPYGRLDSKHRINMAKHYFSRVSHQVIILSQDEEVVDKYYKILKPAIANEFTITYNPKTRTPEVTHGYNFLK